MSKGNGAQGWMQNLGLENGFTPGAGMRSPGFGSGMAPATTALPASLASLINQQGQGMMGGGGGGGAPDGGINMQALQTQPTGTVASNPNYPVLDFRMQPTYADGGQVGPEGMPMMGGEPMQSGMPMQGGQQQAMSQPIPMQEMEQAVQQTMQSNPQAISQMRQVIMQAIQSGELTMEQLNTAVQLATAAAQNPALYPRLRQLAIQRGLATEQDLPAEYDQGIVFAILMAGAAVQQELQGAQAGGPMQQLANGGRVQTFRDTYSPGFKMGGDIPEEWSPTDDKTGRADDIQIRVSGGEYVVPKHVVEAKGTDFFDMLLEKYKKGDEKDKAKT
jgi:hypothetical protein